MQELPEQGQVQLLVSGDSAISNVPDMSLIHCASPPAAVIPAKNAETARTARVPIVHARDAPTRLSLLLPVASKYIRP
jgi:hypothetical protein